MHNIGNIAPMAQIEMGFHFSHEGSVHYSFKHDNKINKGILIGYVTHLGGDVTMNINNDGTIEIKQI